MVPVKELPGVLDTLHKRLRMILLPKFKVQITFCTKDGKDFIFTLNATEPGKKDKEYTEGVRGCLSDNREWRRVVVKMPLGWYIHSVL